VAEPSLSRGPIVAARSDTPAFEPEWPFGRIYLASWAIKVPHPNRRNPSPGGGLGSWPASAPLSVNARDDTRITRNTVQHAATVPVTAPVVALTTASPVAWVPTAIHPETPSSTGSCWTGTPVCSG